MGRDTNKQRMCLPFFYDCIIEKNTIYFPMANYNAMCKADLENNEVDIIDIFPNIASDERTAYTGMFKYKNYFLFSQHPKVGTGILVYNIIESKFSMLTSKDVRFYANDVFTFGEALYIVSKAKAEIYKVDFTDFSVKRIGYKIRLVENETNVGEVVRRGNYIFIPFNTNRIVLVFDMLTETFRFYEFPENIPVITTMSFFDDNWWITGVDKKIYVWNMEANTISENIDFPCNIKLFYSGETWFGNSFIYKNILWLFPVYADGILKYNILTKKLEKFGIPGEEEMEGVLEDGRFFVSKYGMVRRLNSEVFFLSSKTRILYELNLETNDIQSHIFKVNNIYNGKLYPDYANGIVAESYYAQGIRNLMHIQKGNNLIIEKKDVSVGEVIYNCMKEKE